MLRKCLSRSLFALLFLFTCSYAQASTTTPIVNQDQFSIGQGDFTTHLVIGPTIFAGGFDDEFFTFSLGANYLMTDILAPGLDLDVQAGNGTFFQFLPNLRAYLPTHERYLPYGLIGLGYAHYPNVDDFNFAIGGGLDYLLSNTVALGIQFRYDLGVGDVTQHRFQFPIQFAVYFKL